TSPVSSWLATCGAPQTPDVPVRTLWVPVDGLRAPRYRRLIEIIAERQPAVGPLVIMLLPSGFTSRDLWRALEPIRLRQQTWQMAIGLPSSFLKGGRPHLVQLGGIRRFAEEWDFTVAVDLCGRRSEERR